MDNQAKATNEYGIETIESDQQHTIKPFQGRGGFMELKEIFEAEMTKHNLTLCRACGNGRNHKRGFVSWGNKSVIHLDREFATRSTLHRGLHEIGHAIHDQSKMRSFEREAQAEKFATDTMREYGLSVPRSVVCRGASYVARKKRHGDNIRNSRNRM